MRTPGAVRLIFALSFLIGCEAPTELADPGESLSTPVPTLHAITVDNISNFTQSAVSDAQPDISGDRIVWVREADIARGQPNP